MQLHMLVSSAVAHCMPRTCTYACMYPSILYSAAALQHHSCSIGIPLALYRRSVGAPLAWSLTSQVHRWHDNSAPSDSFIWLQVEALV